MAAFPVTLVSAAGGVTVSISAQDEVDKGSFVFITVDISEVADLNAVQYDITFDPTLFSIVDISDGNIGGTAIPVMTNEISPGHQRIVQSLGLSSVSGEGYLSQCQFEAIKAGTGTIGMTGGTLSGMSGDEIPATWTGATVTVISDVEEPPSEPDTSGGGTPADSGDETGGEDSTSSDETIGGDTSPGEETPAGGDTGSQDTTSGEDTGQETDETAGEPELYTETEDSDIIDEKSSESFTPIKDVDDKTTGTENGVKWPVLLGIIGGVVVIICVILYERIIRRRLY